jgi:acetyltransferase-like isoleucine patch superfamily enzyme
LSHTEILVEQENANDINATLVEWLVAEGKQVEVGTPVALLETTKAVFEIVAPARGFLVHLFKVGDFIPVRTALGFIAETSEFAALKQKNLPADIDYEKSSGELVISHKARDLMKKHGLTEADFPGIKLIRSQDVEACIRGKRPESGAKIFFGDQQLDPEADWDAVLQDKEYLRLTKLLTDLRMRMKAKFNRHVPVGDLLNDRWQLASDYGFLEGTSVYDTALILGDVKLGRHCWVGPFTVLDGNQAPLKIGDYSSIGSGAQIYTHHTIEKALSGHQAKLHASATTIGRCCFISPLAVVAPGTILGDHCFVAVGSYVEGIYPSHSYIAGNPARIVGHVEIKNDRVYLRLTQSSKSDT